MLTVNDIPQEWKDLLAEIQATGARAVIAGGCLRDLDNGVAPKDIDIFIEAGDDEEAANLNEVLGGKNIDNPEKQWYPESMREVILVSGSKKDAGLPVEFIFVNWQVSNILARFDYGFCRLAFDGKDVTWDEQYDQDKANKVMTLMRCESEGALASSVRRFARWRDKYPEHDWCLGCRLDMGATASIFI